MGTAVAVGTGVGAMSGRVMNALMDHSLSRAKIVPVLALKLSLLTPLNITMDPTTVGKAVTVIVESC